MLEALETIKILIVFYVATNGHVVYMTHKVRAIRIASNVGNNEFTINICMSRELPRLELPVSSVICRCFCSEYY